MRDMKTKNAQRIYTQIAQIAVSSLLQSRAILESSRECSLYTSTRNAPRTVF